MQRPFSEPLLHFLLIGAGLFVLYQVVAPDTGESRTIVVTDDTVAMLSHRHLSVWLRPPTAAEMQALIDTYVRDEILYREGLAMGLDRDDPVIQRRVLQKLNVLSEEAGSLASPDDAELTRYLQANAQRYAIQPIVSFEQVLFDPVRYGSDLEREMTAALRRLEVGADRAELGERSLLPAEVPPTSLDRIARDFGDEFAGALQTLPVGQWAGPVRSGFGAHLVKVNKLQAGRPASLDEVRAAVERDWENDRRIRSREAYYQDLLQNYDVRIDANLPGAAAATGRDPAVAASE